MTTLSLITLMPALAVTLPIAIVATFGCASHVPNTTKNVQIVDISVNTVNTLCGMGVCNA